MILSEMILSMLSIKNKKNSKKDKTEKRKALLYKNCGGDSLWNHSLYSVFSNKLNFLLIFCLIYRLDLVENILVWLINLYNLIL